MSDISSNDQNLFYKYKFIFENGVEKEFEINLDGKTLRLKKERSSQYPKWVELKCFKCPNCPLNEAQHQYCPVAANIVELIDSFGDSISYEKVKVIVETDERNYSKEVALQTGVSSLIGIYMVTSGCPILDKLKPMVRFHLPFATIEETVYRAVSMYLLAQYFSYKVSSEADWDLKHLVEVYDNVGIVNESFCKRLRSTDIKDASLNAVVVLDVFAGSVHFTIDRKKAEDLAYLFEAVNTPKI